MSEIESCELGDLIEFQRGYDLPKNKFINGPYPVQSSNGILGYHNEYKVEGPGITIGRSGTVGLPHFLEENFYPHNTALFIKDFKDNDIRYIYYLLRDLKLGDKKSGSGVPTMNRNHLHPLKIRAFRSFNEQKKIVSVLATLDKKIELNNRINSELEAMVKTLYDYWFVQFDFPDKDGKPYKSSGGKMVWNEVLKREIPQGWGVGSLVDIATFTNGIACQKYKPKKNEAIYKVIKIREFTSGLDTSSDSVHQSVPKKIIVNNGDILFSWSATLEVKLWSGGTGALNQHIFKVTSENFPKTFYYFEILKYLEHFKMIAELRKTTMGHITKDHLVQSRICMPPKDMIRNIDEKISPIFNKIIGNKKQELELVKLRDWLLPMLMNGQVRVD